jgi:hypothetical protein
MSVFLYRHQAGGLVTDLAFAEPPTDEQLAPLRARMLLAHGDTHRRTGAPYWDRVVEVPLFGPGAVPAFPGASDGDSANVSASPEFAVSGSGTVTPR